MIDGDSTVIHKEEINYSVKDIILFMRFLASVAPEKNSLALFEYHDSESLKTLSDVALGTLSTTYPDTEKGACFKETCRKCVYQCQLGDDIYDIVFRVDFKNLPTWINHSRELVRRIARWRLEEGI